MASRRDIRRRIGSVRNIKQITRAMQMVAASKMARAQEAALSTRPFAQLLYRIQRHATTPAGDFTHPLLEVRPVRKRAAILFSTDKGLCGALNTNLFRLAAQFDPATRRLTYVNAGHCPPILLRSSAAGRNIELLNQAGGTVVGLVPDVTYEQAHVHLSSGDLLVIYTDGFSEAMSPKLEEWGETRLLDSRHDVLPAIGIQQASVHTSLLVIREGAPRIGEKVLRVGLGLHLQQAVDGAEQFDQIVKRTIARRGVEFCIVARPFEFVDNRVLRLLFPVKQEHVLE